MIKPRKKRRNRYQESRTKRLRGNLRKFRAVAAVFAGFCLVLLLGAALSRLYNALLNVPWLKVEEIEITGLNKLDRFEILNAMGISRGECILNLRMAPVAHRLEAIPRVKSAAVRLDMPGKIVADVVERTPLAVLACGDSRMLMDGDGVVYARAGEDETLSVPLVGGLCGPDVKEGTVIASRDLRRARELVSALEKAGSWLSASSIHECRWSGANGFTLVLGERNVPVDIGKEGFEAKLAKLRKVIAALDERQWTELVTRIDLDYPGKAFLSGEFPVPKQPQGPGKQPG